MSSPHIAPSSINTHGTALDLMARPGFEGTAQCQDLIRQVIEGIMVVFPKEIEQSIANSFIDTLRQLDGQIAGLNLIRVSTDLGNAAELGTDGGVFVGRPTVSSNTPATSGAASFSLNLDSAQFSGDYVASVAPMADPGAFRWWLISKTPSHLTVGYHSTNPVSFLVSAQS